MGTLDILKERNNRMFYDQVKDVIVNGSVALSGLFAAGAVLAAIALYLGEGATFNFFVTFPVFIISVVILKKISPYQKRFVPKNHKLIFKQFYSYYESLIQLDLKEPKSIKKTISATESLAYNVDNWVLNVVPSAVKIIPQSLKSSLENDVIYLLKSKDKEKIHQLQNYFLKLCDLLSIRELTFDEWINTIKNIIGISSGRNIESIKLEEILYDEQPQIFSPSNKDFSLRFFVNPKIYGLIIFPILFTILFFEDHGIGMSLVYGGMGSAGILASIEYVKKHTKSNLKSQN